MALARKMPVCAAIAVVFCSVAQAGVGSLLEDAKRLERDVAAMMEEEDGCKLSYSVSLVDKKVTCGVWCEGGCTVEELQAYGDLVGCPFPAPPDDAELDSIQTSRYSDCGTWYAKLTPKVVTDFMYRPNVESGKQGKFGWVVDTSKHGKVDDLSKISVCCLPMGASQVAIGAGIIETRPVFCLCPAGSMCKMGGGESAGWYRAVKSGFAALEKNPDTLDECEALAYGGLQKSPTSRIAAKFFQAAEIVNGNEACCMDFN